MSNGADSSEKRPSLPIAWPTVLLVAVGLCAYLMYEPPLHTARPPIPGSHEPRPPTVPEVGAVYTRLWDDPLEPAYQDHARRAGENAGGTGPLSEFLQWFPVFKRKGIDGSGPIEPLPKEGFASIAKAARDRTDANGRLLVMPVLLRGGPCGEDKEDRMRIQYAVLAALSNCGYAIELPTRMSYVRLKLTKYFKVLDQHVRDRDLIMPVKLYGPDRVERNWKDTRPFGGVLICWLNEDQLGDHRLEAVKEVVKRLFSREDRRSIELRIIGPTGSDGLLAMGEEALKNAKCSDFHCLNLANPCQLLSPRATVWRGALRAPDDKGQSLEDQLWAVGIKLVHAIGTDRQLAVKLLEELKHRDTLPRSFTDKSRRLVLITERDTLYGRAIPTTFRMALEKKHGISEDCLSTFAFLRGIDGQRPAPGGAGGPSEPAGDAKRAGKGQGSPIRLADSDGEPAEGPAQLDYLRRLDQHLPRLMRELAEESRRGDITAIGVMGTDFFDKLLVLRALRRQFPRTWFFTTDGFGRRLQLAQGA